VKINTRKNASTLNTRYRVFSLRSLTSTSILIYLIISPNLLFGQTLTDQINEAIGLYETSQPSDASIILQTVLTSPDALQLPVDLRAKSYTYLAMSEWSLYRRIATEAAVISALELDAATFILYGDSWANENPTIIDSVANKRLVEAIFQYDEAEYTTSIERLITILPVERYISSNLASEIHKYLAFNFVAQRKRKLAQQEFQTALKFNPNLTLGDDASVAPKIRRTYLTIKDNTIQRSSRNAQIGTILRSLVLPGWGQIHRGNRLRGYGYLSMQTGLLTGSILSLRSYSQARDAYGRFGATDAVTIYNRQDDINEVKTELNHLYNNYQSKGQRANVFIGLLATVWAVNVVDAMWLSWRKDEVEFTTNSSPSGRLAMDWDQQSHRWQVQYTYTW
jgi:hypothetical protein